MTQIRVYSGERLDQPDDEDTIDTDDVDDVDDCVQAAIDWSADRWPESDHGYKGVVWARTLGGELIGRRTLSIDPSGEIDD